MKNNKLFIPFLFLAISLNLFGQDYSSLNTISLANKEECEEAQSKILECCNYLLSKPCVEDLNSLNAMLFIMKWMRATPDFLFGTNDNIYKAIKSNDILSGIYYGAIAKIAIEKNIKDNSEELHLESITLFLEYCENPENNVKISNKLQKLIDAKNNGTLKGRIKGA